MVLAAWAAATWAIAPWSVLATVVGYAGAVVLFYTLSALRDRDWKLFVESRLSTLLLSASMAG